MKTIVLDDDPTGTQSACDVTVLFDATADTMTEALRTAQSIYVQTNSRAIDEEAARRLVAKIHDDGLEAGRRLRENVRFVLRGDSTLRGHVFAETEEFLNPYSVMVFVPAFPDGGRTTHQGTHYVQIAGRTIPAHDSEYAKDPVFPFETSVLTEYVASKSGRVAVHVPLDDVRLIEPLIEAILAAPPGSVIVPDAVTNDDIQRIAQAIERASNRGASTIVRCASPLAAMLAGVESTGLLTTPIISEPEPTLLICGSHTDGASKQLSYLAKNWGTALTLSTDEALENPSKTGEKIASNLRSQLDQRGLAILSSERQRSAIHNTLQHGEKIMSALTSAVEELRGDVNVVISKGGITSSEVARRGLGATQAHVLGQILPGVSIWNIDMGDNKSILYVVVPGNVGDERTLLEIVQAMGFTSENVT